MIFVILYFRAILFGPYFLVGADHRNLTSSYSGTSAKVVRWSLSLQHYCVALALVTGMPNVVAEALSCAPLGASAAVGAIRLLDFKASPSAKRIEASPGAGSPSGSCCTWLDAVCNEIEGRLGVHALRALQIRGFVWRPRLPRELIKCFLAIGVTPHDLIHWVPTDRDLFVPIEELKVILPLSNDNVASLQGACECFLYETSMHILQEQERVREEFSGAIPTDFPGGSFALKVGLSGSSARKVDGTVLYCCSQGQFDQVAGFYWWIV